MDERPEDWVEVGRFASREDGEQHALVLAAMGLRCRLFLVDGSAVLSVAPSDAAEARRQLAAYDRENRPAGQPPLRRLGEGIDGALLYWAALVFVHAAASRHAFSYDWVAAGRAEAGPILAGQWWRAITALGLHADFGHLLSNLAMGSLFGILLAQLLGAGLAWLAILLAGSFGNVLNAVFHSTGHASIGASTAVFAALGLLAALTLKRRELAGLRGPRRWAPVAAGAMLLVFTGTAGERTDIGAHVAGFATGCVFGFALHLLGPGLPQDRRAQYGFGAAALGLFVLAWVLALRAGGL